MYNSVHARSDQVRHNFMLDLHLQYISNKNYEMKHRETPKKLSDNPTEPKTNSRPLFKVPEQHNFSHSRKSSEGYTNYETHPQYFGQDDHEANNSIQYEEHSICASIQNGMFEGMLGDLKNQIKLKTQALTLASSYIIKLEETNKALQKQNQSLKKQIQSAFDQIKQLQAGNRQLEQQKAVRLQSKRSITKTYISQKNIGSNQSSSGPLALISSQIFHEFAQNYESLVSELANFVAKQQQNEYDGSMKHKMEMHSIEVDELMMQKSDQQYSKTTYETTTNDRQYSSHKKLLVPYTQQWSTNSTSSCNEVYQQMIQLYREEIDRLTIQLHEATAYVTELSRSMSASSSSMNQLSQPSTLLPKQLIKMIIKQCGGLMRDKYLEMKSENMELVDIIQGIIKWVERNSKDGGSQFRTVFSSVL